MWKATAEIFECIVPLFTQRKAPLLLAWVDGERLCLSQEAPQHAVGEVAYFLRTGDRLIYPDDDFDAMVQHGVLHADYLGSLARVMHDVFSPLLAGTAQWPDSVRDEFAAGMNRFMSALTDASQTGAGKTVLYVPNERVDGDPAVLAQDRELVQRLDATVIHWTRQIKEVLSGTAGGGGEGAEGGAGAGSGSDVGALATAQPLDELDFWKQRCDDMTGIAAQLDRDSVSSILDILRLAKSSYLPQFTSWSNQIKKGMAVVRSFRGNWGGGKGKVEGKRSQTAKRKKKQKWLFRHLRNHITQFLPLSPTFHIPFLSFSFKSLSSFFLSLRSLSDLSCLSDRSLTISLQSFSLFLSLSDLSPRRRKATSSFSPCCETHVRS